MDLDQSHTSSLILFEELKQLQRIDLHILFDHLTTSEFLALRAIDRCRTADSGLTNVHSLVEQTTVSPQAVSKILGTLERKNYIVRSLNPADHRSISISLTPHGQEVYSVSLQHLEHYLDAVTDRMGKDNLAELLSQLHRFRTACREELNYEMSKTSGNSF